jgi:hypothetical protein
MTDEIDTYADVQALEEKFIESSDHDRLVMLANGEAPATDRLIYLGQQSLARALLNQQLGAQTSTAVPLK